MSIRPDTAAIRAQADAATEGPWVDNPGWESIWGPDGVCVADYVPEPLDRFFIINARTDVPILCDRVEQMEAVRDALLVVLRVEKAYAETAAEYGGRKCDREAGVRRIKAIDAAIALAADPIT